MGGTEERSKPLTKLNQIIAVEKGTRTKGERALTDAYHLLQKSGELTGQTRVYTPRDDDGDRLPEETTLLQVRVPDVVADVQAAVVRMLDVAATKENTNRSAVADVVVDGRVLLRQVPVVVLVQLERKVADLQTFVAKLPVLDPAVEWTWDATSNAWRSQPVFTVRSKKVPRNHVLAKATDKHAEQVQVYHEDVPVGMWETTRFSGAITAVAKKDLLTRVGALLDALRTAREEANAVDVVDLEVGEAIWGYLFAPLG